MLQKFSLNKHMYNYKYTFVWKEYKQIMLFFLPENKRPQKRALAMGATKSCSFDDVPGRNII